MVSTFTPNVQLEEPARGDDVGTWDTPVNGNTTNLDLMLGGIATISLNNSNVVLSAAQYRSKQITFNSTLTGSVTITFPTSFTKSYEIQHLCTGSSAFTITLQTTAAGGEVICASPGETIDCFNDGTNLRFKNLGRVGSYWDYAGSSVPSWVSGCTKPPYLNCNGGTFSATTYPQLAVVLGSTTTPDMRGRTRFTFDPSNGTGRLTNIISGGLLFSAGGADTNTLVTGNLPAYTPTTASISLGSFLASVNGAAVSGNTRIIMGGGAGQDATVTYSQIAQGSPSITMNAQGGVSAAFGNVPPGIVSGLTLIRAG